MKNTLNFCTSLLIIVLFISCGQEEKKTTQIISDSDRETLKYLKEVEWPKAYAEQDTILLDRILGEDFRMIDNSGEWHSKKDELEWIKNNAAQNDSFRFEIKRFDIMDNGTAFICGTGHILNDSVKTIYQSSNVLVKREGIWKAVLSHVSGVSNVE